MRRFVVASVAVLSIVVASGVLLGATAPQQPQPETRAVSSQAAPKVLTDLPALKPLKYRSIGPAWGGRVTRVAGVAGDPNTCYAGAASGGVWKSTDGGLAWTPVFDDQSISSIGSIAVAPSDPNVIYVGSGEANIRGNVAAGNGIYRSLDAGKTWTHQWKQEGQIGTIVVHPTRPEVAYAAVLGKAFGPNPERGVYRTKDGGQTWVRVLEKDADTGASDVALDPSNPNIVFAGLWQARRSPWSLQSGGPGSGLYVSRDGGDTWTRLDGKEKGKGLPDGPWGRVGIAVAPSDGRRVYAIIEAEPGRALSIRRWRRLVGTGDGEPPDPTAALVLLDADRAPGQPERDLVPASRLRQEHRRRQVADLRQDQGLGQPRHLDRSEEPEADDHRERRRRGSVDRRRRARGVAPRCRSASSTTCPPTRACRSTWPDRCRTSGPRRPRATACPARVSGTWTGTAWVAEKPDTSFPTRPTRTSSTRESTAATSRGTTTGPGSRATWRIFPENPSGHGAADFKYRFQWTAPMLVSPHDAKVIYHAGNVLFRTNDGGQSWTAISGDLTRNDRTKQQWSGGPITGDNTGVETYGTDLRAGGVAAAARPHLGRERRRRSCSSRGTAERRGPT